MKTVSSENFVDKLNSGLEKATEWAGKNSKLVLGLFIAILVIGGVATAVSYKNSKDQGAAFAKLAPLEKEFSNWKLGQNPDPTQKPATPPPKVNPEELYNKLVQFVDQNGDTKASQMAVLMATELAYTLNKEAQVLELVDKKVKINGKSVLSGLTLMKKGDWLANADKCDEAIKTWQEVISKKDWSYLHDFAHLKSGLCFEQLAKTSDAEAQYDRVINMKDGKADRWAYKEAQKFKRALKWSQKQGS